MSCTLEDRSRKEYYEAQGKLRKRENIIEKIVEEMSGIYGPDQTHIDLE
jgi:hypothetical protein